VTIVVVVAIPVVVVPVAALLPVVAALRSAVVRADDLNTIQGDDGGTDAVIVDMEDVRLDGGSSYETEIENVGSTGGSGERLRPENRNRAGARRGAGEDTNNGNRAQ